MALRLKVINHGPLYRRRRLIVACTAASAFTVPAALGGELLYEHVMQKHARAESSPVPNQAGVSDTGSICSEPHTTAVGSIAEQFGSAPQTARDALLQVFDTQYGEQADRIYADALGKLGLASYQVVYEEDKLPDVVEDASIYVVANGSDSNLDYIGSEVIRGVSAYPPGLLAELDDRISVVESIDFDRSNPFKGAAEGVHASFGTDRNPFQELIVTTQSSRRVIVHEIAHSLQKEVCKRGSRFHAVVSQLQAEGKMVDYVTDDNLMPAQWVSLIWSGRQYPSSYSARNDLEHWAEVVTELLLTRGMVLEGDDDWGSPYQQVQYAIIDDIDARFPGFKNAVRELTNYFHISPTGAYNEFKASEINVSKGASEEAIARAREEVLQQLQGAMQGEGSFRVLKGATVVVSNYPGEPNSELLGYLVHDPILYLDPITEVPYIVFTNTKYGGDGLEASLRVLPYSPSEMTLLMSGDAYVQEINGSDTVEFDSEANGITVEGQLLAIDDDIFINPTNIIYVFTDLSESNKVLYPKNFLELVR